MGISNFQQKLADLHEVWIEQAREVLDSAPEDYKRYTEVTPINGTKMTPAFVSDQARLREWIGDRQVEHLKAHSKSYDVKSYDKTFAVSRVELKGDSHGMIAKRIQANAQAGGSLLDEKIMEKMLTGFSEEGYDEVAFFSTAHPDGPGGTVQSNTSTAVLSATSFEAARAAMRSLRQENGRSLKIRPSLLVVGSKNERTAKTIVEAPLSGGGDTNVDSTFGVSVLVHPELEGDYDDYWFLVDDTKVDKPMILGVLDDLKAEDDIGDYTDKPEHRFSISGEMAIGFGLWQLVYGSTGAS